MALLVICFGALALGAASLSAAFDPLDFFSTGLVAPLERNDRDEKALLFQHLRTKPEVLILGSSRMMKTDPRCVTKLTGLAAFNFGLTGARAEDFLAVFRYVSASDPSVRRLLIGVDPEMFQGDRAAHYYLLKSRFLRSHVPSTYELPLQAALVRYGTYLLSKQPLSMSLQSLQLRLLRKRPTPTTVFRPDGFVLYPLRERTAVPGAYADPGRLAPVVASYAGRYTGFVALSPARLATFQTLLAEARARGVAVDVLIPPLSPVLEQALRETTLQARTEETIDVLKGLAKHGWLHYVELPTVQSFGGDAASYYDGVHMMESNVEKLLRSTYGRPRVNCAVQ